MIIAIIAALCMVLQDIFEVLKMQSAARERGWLVALFDELFWLVSIAGTTIATFTLHGGSMPKKAAVVMGVSVANVVGNLIGTFVGKRFIRDNKEEVQDERMASIEARIEALENDTITNKQSLEN